MILWVIYLLKILVYWDVPPGQLLVNTIRRFGERKVCIFSIPRINRMFSFAGYGAGGFSETSIYQFTRHDIQEGESLSPSLCATHLAICNWLFYQVINISDCERSLFYLTPIVCHFPPLIVRACGRSGEATQDVSTVNSFKQLCQTFLFKLSTITTLFSLSHVDQYQGHFVFCPIYTGSSFVGC